MKEPTLHVGVRREDEQDRSVRQVGFVPGVSLRDILNSSSVRVRSACSGIGGCGLCRVRIDAGSGGPLSPAELLHLSEKDKAEGVRLACQILPRSSMDVTVLLQARPSPWRAPILAPYLPSYPVTESEAPADARFGIAVDLGTTSISLAACNLSTGQRIAVRTGPNPQSEDCSDIVGRLQMASESPEQQRRMQSLAVDAIHNALYDLLGGEGIPAKAVARLEVVGNSAMLALLSGANPRPLLDPKRWNSSLESDSFLQPDLARRLDLNPETEVSLVPALGGFVGSDLVMGVVHTRMLDLPAPSVLIDFGTNSEMGLWDGRQLWVAAAAGGPAFEGIGIGCGMAAELGAIHRLTRSRSGDWKGECLGSDAPRGICGSGLVDLLAHLAEAGQIDELGRPTTTPIDVDVAGQHFTVSKADIDTLQQAKAAVAAGLDSLCRLAGLPLDDLQAVHIAGAFGEHLQLENAVRIGLLPAIPDNRFHLAGNTALAGALDILLSPQAEEAMRAVRRKTKIVNLSLEDSFDELFVEHLFLRPFRASARGSAAPGHRFASQDCARAFMRTAQYMASMLPGAQVLPEASQIVHAAFGLDTVSFLPHDAIDDAEALAALAPEAKATVRGMLRQVLDSGFMATEATPVPRPAVWIALPVTVHSRTEAILLAGYYGTCEAPRDLLESLLGVVVLVGATLERQSSYYELRDSGIQNLLTLNAIGDGVCRVDTAGTITFANKAALDILGCTEQELIGTEAATLHITHSDVSAAAGAAGIRHETMLRRKDGTTFPAELICIPIFSMGHAAGFVATFADLTERKAQAALSRIAYFDPLTRIPNRRLLSDRLAMAIAGSKRHKAQLAVLFIDLDFFKEINDNLGHDAGDQALVEIARRLSGCVREGDTVARLGGDEFILVQIELTDRTDAIRLLERLHASIQQPMHLSGYEVRMTASIGIAFYPQDGTDADVLLKCADRAMYRAKRASRAGKLQFRPLGHSLDDADGGRRQGAK